MPSLNIDPNLANHPKTLKMIRIAGEGAFRCLIALWGKAAHYRPDDGNLVGYDADDIEAFAGWTGERGLFYNAIKNCGTAGGHGFLEESHQLHDWEEHEGHLKAYRIKASKMKAARIAKMNLESEPTTTTSASTRESTSQSSNERQERVQERAQVHPVQCSAMQCYAGHEVESSGETGGVETGEPARELPPSAPDVKNSPPGSNGNGHKLKGDHVEFQPLCVAELKKRLRDYFPNVAKARISGLAGSIEKLWRDTGQVLDPEEACMFATVLLRDARERTVDEAFAFIGQIEKPANRMQVIELCQEARTAVARRHGANNGRGP